MRMLYLTRVNQEDRQNSGVIKKIQGQQLGFQANGIACDLISLKKDGIYLNEDVIHEKRLTPHTLSTYWFYFLHFAKVIWKKIPWTKYDCLYVRHPFFDPQLFALIKKVKKRQPGLKIIFEIATYPYDHEPQGRLHKISLQLDRIYRKQASAYIDLIVTPANETSIWGIPVMSINNGIAIQPLIVAAAPTNSIIQFIAIGNWSYWHGLDRMIIGLHQYYSAGNQQQKISLQILGAGNALAEYKTLVAQYALENIVTFSTPIFGSELNELLAQADLGIGTIARHRTAINKDPSLKNREYTLAGIPFVLATEDLDFPKGTPFVHYIPATDAPVSIEELLTFIQTCNSSRAEIHQYAVDHLSWKTKLQPVVNYILNLES